MTLSIFAASFNRTTDSSIGLSSLSYVNKHTLISERSPKNTETVFVRRWVVAWETSLVAQKRRNCVRATGAHKHCKFINRSILANFGEKNKNYN